MVEWWWNGGGVVVEWWWSGGGVMVEWWWSDGGVVVFLVVPIKMVLDVLTVTK